MEFKIEKTIKTKYSCSIVNDLEKYFPKSLAEI